VVWGGVRFKVKVEFGGDRSVIDEWATNINGQRLFVKCKAY